MIIVVICHVKKSWLDSIDEKKDCELLFVNNIDALLIRKREQIKLCKTKNWDLCKFKGQWIPSKNPSSEI